MVLVCGNCVDFWRLLWESGVRVERHTLFYPNPYPKVRDLSKRWHGDPAFGILLRLGGELEVRGVECGRVRERERVMAREREREGRRGMEVGEEGVGEGGRWRGSGKARARKTATQKAVQTYEPQPPP